MIGRDPNLILLDVAVALCNRGIAFEPVDGGTALVFARGHLLVRVKPSGGIKFRISWEVGSTFGLNTNSVVEPLDEIDRYIANRMTPVLFAEGEVVCQPLFHLRRWC